MNHVSNEQYYNISTSFLSTLVVLEFRRSLTLKRGRVMPVCLPSLDYKGGASVLVSGWGRMKEGKIW